MPITQISDSGVSLFHRWVLLSFVYFIIAGCMGAFLRLQLFHPVLNINYKYFLHGHSHLAFLGWVFNALFVALLYAYLPAHVKRYQWLFRLWQVSVIGMLISFPLQGYAAVSITFSTLHILLFYRFAYKFLQDIRREPLIRQKHALSIGFVKWSLFFMVLSSLGPFALGAIMAKGMAGTNLYQLAIYFYLHFQYDGWFSFAVIGLFFWMLEANNVHFNQKKGRYFLLGMAIACIPAYALSTLWTHPPVWVYIIATFAVILQVSAIFPFLQILISIHKKEKQLSDKRIYGLLFFAGMAFFIKVFLLCVSAIPAIADIAYMVRNFTIGYLHLIFLGFITIFLIAWFAEQGFLQLAKLAIWGIGLLLAGFTGSELYIFLQPLFLKYNLGAIPFYNPALFVLSLLMPLGTSLFVWASFQQNISYSTSKKIVAHSINS